MKDLRQRLLATFRVEHNEHVLRIREALAAFESSEGTTVAGDLDEIFRRAHSLKGAARAVDLRPIEHLAHRLETLFSRVREGALPLDKPAVKVVHRALDASEDWLASSGGAQEPPAPVDALVAIDVLLGATSTAPGTAPASPAVPAAVNAPASAVAATLPAAAVSTQNPVAATRVAAAANGKPPSETVDASAPAAAPIGQVETLRLNAESLDRIVSSAGQLLTESLRQSHVTRQLRQMSQDLSDTSAERDRIRKANARVFQRLDSSPELTVAARYVNYLDHQIHLLTKQVGAAVRLQSNNAWTLRSLAGELQRDVRQARMVPAENVFDGFRKMVRDLARDAGKTVDLHVSGWQVAADRLVLQALKDPVMHMLRNAVSHGLETEAERRTQGKHPEGRIDLSLAVRGNGLTIAVEDDGRGIDVARIAEIALRKGLVSPSEASARSAAELMRLILLPGFSTSRAITELSGRGMGLSVVAQTVARLQGTIDISAGSHGGTRVALSVPLSVSSHRLLLVSCQSRTFAVPLHGIERLHRVKVADVRTVESKPVIAVDGQMVPVVSLAHLLNAAEPEVTVSQNTLSVMLMRSGVLRLAVAVDAFLSERDAIIKELPPPADRNGRIAGGVLLEDGSVCLVINPSELVDGFQQSANGLVLASDAQAPVEPAKSLEILVVDDSLTTRTLEKSVLEANGYEVAIAVDGVEALSYLRGTNVGLVISDVQMPRLDGLGLLKEMKADPRLAKIPVIIVSSLENPEDQARGLTLGADAYIVKRKFEQQELLETVRQIL